MMGFGPPAPMWRGTALYFIQSLICVSRRVLSYQICNVCCIKHSHACASALARARSRASFVSATHERLLPRAFRFMRCAQ